MDSPGDQAREEGATPAGNEATVRESRLSPVLEPSTGAAREVARASNRHVIQLPAQGRQLTVTKRRAARLERQVPPRCLKESGQPQTDTRGSITGIGRVLEGHIALP